MASKNFSPHEPKPRADPKATIKEILKIVDQLHTKLPPSQIITTSRSLGAGSGLSNQNKRLESVLVQDDSDNVIPKLQSNLHLLREGLVKVQDLREDVVYEVRKHFHPLNSLLKRVEFSKTQLTIGMKKDLEDINKKIFNLMFQVPLLPNTCRKERSDSEDRDRENNGRGIVCLPGIHENEEDLQRLAVFREVRDKFEKLSTEKKFCLLSFAVFPENQEVNRTMLMYWWIGEGILPDFKPPEEGFRWPTKVNPEVTVKEILKEFMDENLIEAVENKRKVEPNSYKMSPFVHSSVVLISKEIGLFDMYYKGEKPTMNKSELHKVCLVEDSSSQPEAKAKNMRGVDCIGTVFNVSERFPDFAFKWFQEKHPPRNKMSGRLLKTRYRNLKVFYLGRWERTPNRHIEIENPELMQHLTHMTKLRLLSFQGISRIETLDEAVCELRTLVILDLRACYNLEKILNNISNLKNLTYLDMSECYMIDGMPKTLSWLKHLEVLKGFVVNDINWGIFCTLAELRSLWNLRKLSVTINEKDFGVAELIKSIKDFTTLENLKVVWGRMNKPPQYKDTYGRKKEQALPFLERTVTMFLGAKRRDSRKLELPKTLRKLDLQCFPDAVLPEWLEPENISYLEKLYIKGGTELTGFGKSLPEKATECKVQVLRLKFLPKLKVDWIQLSQLYFPKVEFLEKYQCPQVSLCPTDGIGIWRKP